MVMASMSRSLQDEVAVPVDSCGPAGPDDRGGVKLLNDGRSCNNRADIETIAFVKFGVHGMLAVEMDATLAFNRNVAGARRRGRLLRTRLVFRNGHSHTHAIAHHLDGPFLGGMPVN